MHFSLPNTVITKLSNYQRECIIIVLRAWRRISKPPQVKQSGDVGTLWKSKCSTLKKHSVPITLKKHTVPITLKKHSGEASEALLAGRCTQLLLVQPSPAAGLLQRHQHFHCQHHHQWQRQQQQQQYLLHNTLLCCWLPLILFASNQDAMVWVEQVKEEGAALTSRQITFVRTCLRLPWGWWQWRQIILLRLLRQNNLAAVRFCSLNASRKVHWGEAIYFLEFRTKISSAKRILLIRTPLSTFIVTCDKIRQLSQSNPKQPTSGADEQWTMVPTFFLQVPWLLSPPKHQKTRIQIQKC